MRYKITDKPIIIDGIKFTENFDIICQTCTRNNPCFQQCNQVYKEIIKYLFNNLQRKTAECEELSNTSSKYYVQVLDERDKLREEVAKFNEKLELIATCGTGPLKEQNKRYKHALEEIEGIVNKKTEIPICDECAYRNIPECKENCMQDVLGEILDIISKAKGEEK